MIDEDGYMPDFVVENIDRRLRDLGKNRTWMAAQMGVTPSLLGRIVNKHTGVKLETLQRMCNALSWRLSDMFGEGPAQLAHEPRTWDELTLWLTAQHSQTLRMIAALRSDQDDRATLGSLLMERLTPDELKDIAREVVAEQAQQQAAPAQSGERPSSRRPKGAPSAPASS